MRGAICLLALIAAIAAGCDEDDRQGSGADADTDSDSDADAQLVCTGDEMAFDAGVDGEIWRPLRDVWSEPSGMSAFAVGEAGWIVRSLDGGAWSRMESGTTADLNGVSGRSAACVYAVGSGGVLLRLDADDDAWDSIDTASSADLLDVWVDADCSAFVVGYGGSIRRYADGDWLEWDSPIDEPLTGVSASPEGLFAVGGPHVIRFDGSQWNIVYVATHALSDVWVDPAGWAVAVGELGEAWTYLGEQWEQMELSGEDAFVAVWGTTLLDVYLLEQPAAGQGARLLHYNGESVHTAWVAPDARYQAMSGSVPRILLVGGADAAQGAALEVSCSYEGDYETDQ